MISDPGHGAKIDQAVEGVGREKSVFLKCDGQKSRHTSKKDEEKMDEKRAEGSRRERARGEIEVFPWDEQRRATRPFIRAYRSLEQAGNFSLTLFWAHENLPSLDYIGGFQDSSCSAGDEQKRLALEKKGPAQV